MFIYRLLLHRERPLQRKDKSDQQNELLGRVPIRVDRGSRSEREYIYAGKSG